MRFIVLLVLLIGALVGASSFAFIQSPQPGADMPADIGEIKSKAEQFYADQSFAKARELYQQVRLDSLPFANRRWVEFRLADTLWRAQGGTQTFDSTIFDSAREQLESLINSIKRVEDRDLMWAEACESLGDWWWSRQQSQNWSQAWPLYQQALDWWAGSSDLDAARRRYLGMVWKMTAPEWLRHNHGYWYGNVPVEILDNALKIAVEPNDKARAHYFIATALRHQGGDWRQQMRIAGEFEGAIVAGKSVDWYDDALFAYGQWLMNDGRPVLLDDGQWTRQQDFPAALAVFQRLLREFRKGDTAYYDDAQAAIKSIVDPSVDVSVTNIFLPGSEIQYFLRWRNVEQIELTLHKVDLTRHIVIPNNQDGPGQWQDRIDLTAAEKIRAWTKVTQDNGEYKPGQFIERFDEPLDIGAYVLTATGGGKSSWTVVLVSDAAIVVKTAGHQVLVFVCDALNSRPIRNAAVRIWKYAHNDREWTVSDALSTTDENGLCVLDKDDFPASPQHSNIQYVVTTNADGRQAYATTYAGHYGGESRHWRIYAFTDRPAYRPSETVQWKLIARSPAPNGFTTPADQTIEYEITDPHGSKVTEGKAELNAFGSAWGSLNLSESMPLGEYQVAYWSDGRNQHIGSATLFRLEEYKLPEFQVSIKTPEQNGKRRSYVLGEEVTVNVQGDYYFGGPVANATVEVVIHQGPFYRWWVPPREYPWLYEDSSPYRWWGGHADQIVKRETIKTDAEGKATLTFETPTNAGQDFQYRVEARVTDASRREITGTDNIRVTRQRYYVHPKAAHNLYQPGEKVEINFKALDANDQPVTTEGVVKVTREEWIEIWIDPTGQEITGDALRDIQEKSRIFPPPPDNPLAPVWQIKFRGYRTEDILTTTVKLDEKGEAEFTFTPQNIGFYRATWTSFDESPLGRFPIHAETAVWVTTSATAQLGYRSGGVEIIVDKDTFRVGQTAPVMISTPTNDRYVLFSVEGDDLYHYQVVHVTGNVKLLQLPIDQRHIPNVYLTAFMTHNGELYQDQKEVTVPPVEQYLTVDVTADREQYQPGEEGHFTVTTSDHAGKPVSAEVTLAVVDESVTYIQQDYAGDPRAFFFDRRQSLRIVTGSTFQQIAYVKLIKADKGRLIDERLSGREQLGRRSDGNTRNELAMKEGAESYGFDQSGGAGGGGGGAFEMRRGARGMADMNSALDQASLGMPMQAMAEGVAASKPAFGANQMPGDVAGMPKEPAVVVRSDFRSTLLWQPAIVTDETGAAKVSLKYADSLTTWKATARAAGAGQQFGIGSTSTRTKMPLIARLQAPRFFLVGDSVTVSGVINNNTGEPLLVMPSLEAEGLTVTAMFIEGGQVRMGTGSVTVPANGEARVDWHINVEAPGVAKLKLTARSDSYSDAMEKTYTVYEHGIEKFIAKSGKVRGNEVTVILDIPSERKVDSTTLAVQIAPSMAVTMLDALPYLIDYPYGCTEQTMSRFLPAAITARTLRDLGVKPETVMAKVFGGIEPAHVARAQPKGKKDLARLDEIVQANMDRLYGFQHGDGGWGWWKDSDTDHFMTAYVLWGMCLARDAGLDVRQDVIDRAAAYLDREIVESEKDFDIQAWLLHALASYHQSMKRDDVGEFQAKALDNLWKNREKLNAYTRSLLALSAHAYGDEAKAQTLVDNLLNGVKRDHRPDTSVIIKGVEGPNQAVIGTAHWGEDGVYRRWSDGGVEATAFALRAILAIDPKNALVEPVTNWLIKNRRGAQWSNTRDTAIVVLALNDYLRSSGELSVDLEYELFVNGQSIVTKKLTAEDAFGAPSRFPIDQNLIRNGANEVRIVRKSGTGPIYFAAESTFFSLEEPVPPAGNEIFVRREYYKLVPRPTLLKGYVYDRLPLTDGGTVTSGERVEVVVTVEAKNNYEYLVFEDLKPAGLEAVALRSGESLSAREMKSGAVQRTFGAGDKPVEAVQGEQAHGDAADYTGRARGVYQELRDRKVAMFIDKLPEGVWEIRYDLRAETPGQFHALPVLGHAMYVPEIRCNGGEVRLTVLEKSDS